MLLAKKTALKLPLSDTTNLDAFVQECLAAGVTLVAVWGDDAASIDDEIDRLIVRKGKDDTLFFTTSSHAAKDDAVAFAGAWDNGGMLRMMSL